MPPARPFVIEGSQRPHPEVERWLAGQQGELGVLARFWFQCLRQAGPDVTEVMHDGHATACVEDLAFAYVAVFRNHLNVGFFLGSILPDPTGLLVGTGKFMRHVTVRPGADGVRSGLHALITASYEDISTRRAAKGH